MISFFFDTVVYPNGHCFGVAGAESFVISPLCTLPAEHLREVEGRKGTHSKKQIVDKAKSTEHSYTSNRILANATTKERVASLLVGLPLHDDEPPSRELH